MSVVYVTTSGFTPCNCCVIKVVSSRLVFRLDSREEVAYVFFHVLQNGKGFGVSSILSKGIDEGIESQ